MLTICTCHAYPALPENLAGVQAALNLRGVSTDVATWQSRPNTPFLLPLCAWDYAREYADFVAWLTETQRSGSLFANSPDLMLWNSNKKYLFDFIEQDFFVAPTWAILGDETAIQNHLREHNLREAVLKPMIGQSGNGVQKIQINQTIENINPQQHYLLQHYIPEVAEQGELCQIFIAGEYSHSIRRVPPLGEWRANSAYGAKIVEANPPLIAKTVAEKIIKTLPETPLYARIDGVMVGEQFCLNEVELIEPALYLHTCSQATERFVHAVADWVNGGVA